MKKYVGAVVVVVMLCIGMAAQSGANQTDPLSLKKNHSVAMIEDGHSSALVDRIISATERIVRYEDSDLDEPQRLSQPLLGGDELFGLWIRISYNGYEDLKKIDISPWLIRGKLTDPNYRTPISFNLDDDAEDDLETGFGFYRYGILEMTPDGPVDHNAWATAFDFMQINGGVEDPYGTLEVWQEFHVNLGMIKNKVSTSSASSEIPFLHPLYNRLATSNRFPRLTLLVQTVLEKIVALQILPDDTPQPLAASEDYLVTRIGFRSPDGEKIPERVIKTFAVAKEFIFRPRIFQHEINPGDITGTQQCEVMCGFASYEQGNTYPSYNIEFSQMYEPSAYTVTQFTPREGKLFYYFHTASSDSLALTFGSNILQGGTVEEEEEGSLGLTVTFDSVPSSVVGAGRWLSFDVDIVGDQEQLGGKITYMASDTFDIGITLSSPRLQENVKLSGIPTYAKLQWDVNVSLDIDTFVRVGVNGYLECDMSADLADLTIFYPKKNETDPDLEFLQISKVPAEERIGAQSVLYVNPEEFLNPNNYVYADLSRDFSSNLGAIGFYLPDMDTPLVEITEIPSHAGVESKLYWGQLRGYASAERGTQSQPDPVHLNLEFDTFAIENILEIRNGYASLHFHVADNGYLSLDTTEDIIGNYFSIEESTTNTALSFSADTLSADDLWVDWHIVNDSGQIRFEDLKFNGFLETLLGFSFGLSLEGKNVSFSGDWTIGESGCFAISFDQEEDVRIDFNLDDQLSNSVLHGYAILSQHLAFDMDWQWKQGEEINDPGFFRINEHHNQPNLKALNLYFVFKDKFGVNITFFDVGIYLSLSWWKGDTILPMIWLIFNCVGDIDVHLLWNGQWYYHLEDW